jgi:hypothetical protein
MQPIEASKALAAETATFQPIAGEIPTPVEGVIMEVVRVAPGLLRISTPGIGHALLDPFMATALKDLLTRALAPTLTEATAGLDVGAEWIIALELATQATRRGCAGNA